ncbi:MAG: NAD-dependent epimerase/dehydratase family protein [Patescibacteria group bacterium]
MKKNKTKILVTGSAGFMGSHLFDDLLEKGHDVYGVDDLSGGFMRNVSDKSRFTKLDLRDREKTAKYIGSLKPEIIFHLAADATEGRSQFTPFSAIDNNVVAYTNLLVPAIKNGLKKMILTSSMSVYGAQQTPFKEDMTPLPEDIYGISKAAMEAKTRVMSQVYGFKYVIFRPHNVYGPRQNLRDPYRNVIGIFINRLMHSKNFYIYGDGKQKRAFSYIDDVIPAMAKSAFLKSCEGEIINIGSDKAFTLNELTDTLLSEFLNGKMSDKFKPEYLPDRPQEVKYAYCSHKVAQKLLGYKAKTDLRTGLRKMIFWAKEVGPQSFVYLTSMDLDHKNLPQTWKAKLI